MNFNLKIFAFLLPGFISSLSLAQLKIATTTTDLEALVKSVSGDKVEVFSIAKGTQDAHQIEAKPSFMLKLRDVDLVISQGLDLESAWLQPLIQGSRNSKIINNKILELGPQLNPLDIPTGKISRMDGDVHPSGSPHFQLDPVRMGQASLLIAQKLSELQPADKLYFERQANQFNNDLLLKTKAWNERIKKTRIQQIVTYHKTFNYFCDRFQIKCKLQLEPKPGIPPTVSHILNVLDLMKKENIKVVFIENYFNDLVSEKIKKEIPGVFIQKVPISVGGEPSIKNNMELIERLVQLLEASPS